MDSRWRGYSEDMNDSSVTITCLSLTSARLPRTVTCWFCASNRALLPWLVSHDPDLTSSNRATATRPHRDQTKQELVQMTYKKSESSAVFSIHRFWLPEVVYKSARVVHEQKPIGDYQRADPSRGECGRHEMR